MPVNRLAVRLFLLAWLLFMPGRAWCFESCSINGSHVLLYKVINFWYDCLPGESAQLCGAELQCRSGRGAQVEYDAGTSVMEIRIHSDFSRLVSIMEPGEGAGGTGHPAGAVLNRAYFGRARAGALTNDLEAGLCFRILDVDRVHYQKVRGLAGDIGMAVKGTVRGLMDGKIALYETDGAIKHCPESESVSRAGSPLSVRLIHMKTGEVPAAYAPVPGQ